MVILGRFSSFSRIVGDAFLFLGGTTLIWSSRARTPSIVVREVTDLYFAKVTSQNLLVLTPVSTSWPFGGRRLISFITLIDF
jgi:hypothetical protein